MAEALWAVVVSLLVVFCAIAGATQRAEPMTATARYLVNMVFSCKRCVLPAINSQAAKAFAGLAKKGPRFPQGSAVQPKCRCAGTGSLVTR
jgi:hypothetical protein